MPLGRHVSVEKKFPAARAANRPVAILNFYFARDPIHAAEPIAMTSIISSFLLSVHSFGPAALFMVAILTAAALARPNHAGLVTPTFARPRLGLPKGVARWLIIAGVGFAALLALGIDLQGLWSTLVGALSLIAIGFVAMWSILSHMLASILIVVFRPFAVGDRVEIIGDDLVVGEVTDLNPVYTTLVADDGGTLQVPNNLFFQKALKRQAPRASARSLPLAA
jgi:small-conductance mechanosensitive channel